MRLLKATPALAIPFLLFAMPLTAQQETAEAVFIDSLTVGESLRALHHAGEWMLQNQNEDGSWGRFPHPAITALGAMGVYEERRSDHRRSRAVDKALAYLLSLQQADGSIYPAGEDQSQSGNYPNYTTSIALLALATVNRASDLEAMRRARKYLQGSQFKDRATVDFGGIGYGKTGRADLSNASWAAEALYFSDYLDREPFTATAQAQAGQAALWHDLQTFLTQCQTLPSHNHSKSISTHPYDQGGFFYRPNESKAGERTGLHNGFISSGSMTYAGLKSMIYASLPREDPRVRGAVSYLTLHYSVYQNPEMGLQGYFYYLHTMAKALDAFGDEIITDADGIDHAWRSEVLGELVRMQRDDGAWANANGRYMESMPALATAYAMITLRVCLGESPLDRSGR